MGIVTAALGGFLILYPLAAGAITTVLLGWVLILGAVAELVGALQSQKAGQFFWQILLSVGYAISGIALAFFPLAGVAALTGMVGTLLLVQAVLVTVTAFQLRPMEGWGWLLLNAGASLLLGLMILAQWPSSSLWAIGTLVGASVLVNGISKIMFSLKIQSVASRVDRFAHGAV
ncbi:MAG: HdeD family acid-resistance protein [Candidatus Eiseniibacteriota bacterium]